MPRSHHTLTRLLVLALASLPACGGGSDGYPTGAGNQNPPPGGQQPPSSTTSTIKVENNRFNPAATTVAVGTTVTWTWNSCSDDGYGGRTCVDHSVTFDDGGSSTQSSGTWVRQFSSAGTFNYRCSVHGAAMAGQIVVR